MRTVLIGLLILGALCLLFSSAEVSAWGIAFSTNDITVYSGEHSDINLNIQNFVGEETKKVYVRFKGDSDVASIVDAEEYYLLKPRTSEDITLRITLPKPAKKSYEVDVEFLAQSTDAGVSLASAKVVSFRITVPDGTLVAGVPAVVKRPLTPEEAERIRRNATDYAARAQLYRKELGSLK